MFCYTTRYMQENFRKIFAGIGEDVIFLSSSLLQNPLFLKIGGTALVLIFLIGLMLAKNLTNLNAALRPDTFQGFQKVAHQGNDGTYNMAYSVFVKMRGRIRKFFLISLLLLFVISITMISMQ